MNWQKRWFNEDYLLLYSSRNAEEALAQVDFISKVLSLSPGERLIDIGCGNGRHDFLLAKMGLIVVGVDQSKTLINEAKNRLDQENLPNLSFFESSIETFISNEPFDVALSLFTSFGYFQENSENINILKAIRRQLRIGSRFFFDYLNPCFVKKHLISEEVKVIEGKTAHIKRWVDHDTVIKEIRISNKCYREEVKLYGKDQLLNFLQNTGFEIEKTYGSYEGEKLTESSERQIFFSIAR